MSCETSMDLLEYKVISSDLLIDRLYHIHIITVSHYCHYKTSGAYFVLYATYSVLICFLNSTLFSVF